MYAVIETPLGRMRIEAENRAIERVFLTEEELLPPEGETLWQAAKQLQEYFAGERTKFELPIRLKGTAFQLAAWQTLMRIPYGESVTYGCQAEMMGNSKACRAVGGANHKNPILIIVPCHRVVAADGVGGFAWVTEKKEYLLAMEREYAVLKKGRNAGE